MAKLGNIKIKQFRSIEEVILNFPKDKPLILIGENNTGKSNIVAAIDLLLGENHPGFRALEESDYFHRDTNKDIFIEAEFLDGALYADQHKKIVFSHIKNRQGDNENIILGSYNNKLYLKQPDRASCMVVYISADRNISWQLSYASKYTMLSKLMHRFHEELYQREDIKGELKTIFDNTKLTFEKIEEFKKFKEFLQDNFNNMIEGMSHSLHIDLETYNPTNFFQGIRILPKEGDAVRSFEELGTGEQQILAISFAHAYAKAFRRGVILVVEEPESHLHPLAQKWLAKQIDKFCEEGLQVIFTTHSPNFIRLEDLEGLVLVRKNADGNTFIKQLDKEKLTNFCIEHGADSQKTKSENIVSFYSANTSTDILEGFFAKVVVLVEGPTEAMSLPEYLQVLGLDAIKCGIAFIPVFGKGNLSRFYRLFQAYGLPVYVIFDNDDEDDKEVIKRKDICNTVRIDSETATKQEDLYVLDECAVFGIDYETTLRNIMGNYDRFEREVRTFLGYNPDNKRECKPLVARETAKRVLADYNVWSEADKLKLSGMVKIKEKLIELLKRGNTSQ